MRRPARRVPGNITHSWTSQVVQYTSRTDVPRGDGIQYWRVPDDEVPPGVVIECLLYRKNGSILGIVNYFPNGSPFGELPGDVLVLVNPAHRRRGIGTALLAEADRRWSLNFRQQSYTDWGWDLVSNYLTNKENS